MSEVQQGNSKVHVLLIKTYLTIKRPDVVARLTSLDTFLINKLPDVVKTYNVGTQMNV